jgi:hypothetical protein
MTCWFAPLILRLGARRAHPPSRIATTILPLGRSRATLPRHPGRARAYCRSMISSENRYPLFGIMLYHPLQSGPLAEYAGAVALGLPVERIF